MFTRVECHEGRTWKHLLQNGYASWQTVTLGPSFLEGKRPNLVPG